MRKTAIIIALVVFALGGCMPRDGLLSITDDAEMFGSQIKLRQMQTRYFDTTEL